MLSRAVKLLFLAGLTLASTTLRAGVLGDDPKVWGRTGQFPHEEPPPASNWFGGADAWRADAPGFEAVRCEGAREYATGCLAPFRTCARFGAMPFVHDPVTGRMPEDVPFRNQIFACKEAAKRPLCPDFSWEKCCMANCQRRDRPGVDDACVLSCVSAPEALAMWARTPPFISARDPVFVP
jgi:hypothetical protein